MATIAAAAGSFSLISFLVALGFQVSGFEDIRVAVAIWALSGLMALVAVGFLIARWRGKTKDRSQSSRQEAERYKPSPIGDKSPLVGDVRVITRGNETLTPSVRFTTEGERGQLFNNLGGRPSALRFVTLGGKIVKEADLPVEIPCGNGKLIIKRFTDTGFWWDEEGTIGDRVQVEFYLSATSAP